MKRLIIVPNKEEGDEYISQDQLLTLKTTETISLPDAVETIQLRHSGEFKCHAFFLPPTYNWILGKDSFGYPILVPLIKKRIGHLL